MTARWGWPALALATLVGGGCTVGRTVPDAGMVSDPDAPPGLPDVPFRPDVGPCEPGTIACASGCARVVSDDLNCGSCGNACPAGTSCALGACGCIAPMRGCEGECIDPQTDVNHCGTCGNACTAAEICALGECIPDCDGPGMLLCTREVDGTTEPFCADIAADPMNCGTCGQTCTGGASCIGGVCACPAGRTNCGGACVDLMTDPANCGACISSCGAGGTCTGGRCSACAPGLSLCGTTVPRCYDTMTSSLHCGACGRSCGGGESCTGGLCECRAGLTDCGTGCLDLMSNVENCGACGVDCGAGGVCTAGACSCASGLTMCGASCHDTTADVAHCGGCDMPCPALVGGICMAGVCGCPPGTTDCMGTCADLTSSRDHCSACGMACPAGEGCSMGTCGVPTRYLETEPPAGTVTFIDACTAPGHLNLVPNEDIASAPTTLPFPFRFWANNLAMGAPVNVACNGFMNLSMAARDDDYGDVPDTAAPNSVLAPHWDDLETRSMGVCVATVGTAPNRRFVVQWQDVHNFADPSTHMTFEVILTEGAGTIDFVYQTMTGANDATTGIENANGMRGINACPGGTGYCAPAAGDVIRFVPIP